ncbi:MAG: tRNA preQ1(34) S-adenosylmethionine ribosyltransferase-isomerase QueA [Thermoplasmata archaeon]
MKLKDFDFVLPKELIAQEPVQPRDSARLLCVWKKSGKIEHRIFSELPEFFESGDVIVLNDTRVIPALIIAQKTTGGKVKLLFLKKIGEEKWEVLATGKLRGEKFELYVGQHRLMLAKEESGWTCISPDIPELLKNCGKMPLPPYIKRELTQPEDYQTVYATKEGSIAAPTAGLHFTEILLRRLKKIGVKIVFLTLHVGSGTFQIPKGEKVEEHRMEEEWYSVSDEAADEINLASQNRKKVCCVGTTTMRALESASRAGVVYPSSGETKLFIYPGYKFQSPVNAFITNFHLPRSTPLLLTSAIIGREKLMEIYRVAIQEKYRFFSFGDAMAVWEI